MSKKNTRPSTMSLTIIRAEGLIKTQLFGAQDPYCLAWISSNQSEKKRTCTVYGGGEKARWDHALMFLVEDLNSEMLHVEVMNENNYRSDNLIGRVEIKCDNFCPHKPETSTHKLQTAKGEYAGEIELSVKNVPYSRPPSRAGSRAASRSGSPSRSRPGSKSTSRSSSFRAQSDSMSPTMLSPVPPGKERELRMLLSGDGEEMSPAALAVLADGFPSARVLAPTGRSSSSSDEIYLTLPDNTCPSPPPSITSTFPPQPPSEVDTSTIQTNGIYES